MSLMSGLYVGTSGLQTSQNALHTTAHNLSNIDTQGYTRQQVVQADKRYNTIGNSYISSQQTGLGVSYAKVRQVRDFFLDKSYRLEAGRSSFYDKSYAVATEIETLFGEMEGVEFQESLEDLWTAVQELKEDPANATNQGLFVNKSTVFLERAQAVYSGLSSYQNTLNDEIKDTVDIINDYGRKILELNRKIVGIETGQTEEANDLRDARNQLIDELAGFGKVTVDEDSFGAVTVQFEDRDFVTRTYINELEAEQDKNTGFYKVVWSNDTDLKGNKVEVFNLAREINSSSNTDIGGLKAMLLLRGNDRGYYNDIPKEKDYYFADSEGLTAADTTGYTLYGNVWVNDLYTASGTKTAYELAREAYSDEVTYYNNYTGNSLLKNTMAEFDKLINGIVTSINNVLNPVDENGNSTGISLFLRKGTLDEQLSTTPAVDVVDDIRLSFDDDLDEDGDNMRETYINPITGREVTKIDEDDEKIWKQANSPTWYTTANLKINPLLLQNYNKLGCLAVDASNPDTEYTKGFMTVDDKENRDLSDALAGLFSEDFGVLNPNVNTESNFLEYYQNLVGDMAIVGNTYKNLSESQALTADSIDASRQMIVGVSDSEELTNMIMYQNAYNASSRYINAVNEMLTNMLNQLAG